VHNQYLSSLCADRDLSGLGFLLVTECEDDPFCGSHYQNVFAELSKRDDVQYLPLRWSKWGLFECKDSQSGILCNVHEIVDIFKSHGSSVQKRRTKDELYNHSLPFNGILHDVILSLTQSQFGSRRDDTSAFDLFFHHGLSSNVTGIVDDIKQWICLEELCDLDYWNHVFLSENFPVADEEDSDHEWNISPEKLIHPAGGEEIPLDEDIVPEFDSKQEPRSK
jgi:hypothetical protein